MDIPLEIRLTLRTGTVYYFQHRELSSPEPHYFIVLNADPLSQRVILLSVVTSKVEKKPEDLPPELIEKIIAGVEGSTEVSEEEKALIRPHC